MNKTLLEIIERSGILLLKKFEGLLFFVLQYLYFEVC